LPCPCAAADPVQTGASGHGSVTSLSDTSDGWVRGEREGLILKVGGAAGRVDNASAKEMLLFWSQKILIK